MATGRRIDHLPPTQVDLDLDLDDGDLRTHAVLLEAGLVDVSVVDGEPVAVIDDLFEAARRAALAGFDDADRHRAARRAHPSGRHAA